MTSRRPAVNVSTDRKTELAKIHIGKAQLGLDEETYRDMLWSIGRVTSSADLDAAGRAAVLEHLKRLGFKARHPGRARAPRRSVRRMTDGTVEVLATADQVALIRHIWIVMADHQVVRDRSEPALRAWIRASTRRYHPQRAGWDAPEFLPDDVAGYVIEHLKQWASRSGVDWR